MPTPPADKPDPAPRPQLKLDDVITFLGTTTLQSVCTQCHTINGTNASGRVGPNLTHIAARPYIAAGSLQNTGENLESWITDPQHIKPGVYMPMNQYSYQDLLALVSYLKSLK